LFLRLGEGKYAKELKTLRENIVRYVLFNTSDSSLFILKEAGSSSLSSFNQSNQSAVVMTANANRTRRHVQQRSIEPITLVTTQFHQEATSASSLSNFSNQLSYFDEDSVIIVDYLIDFRNKIIEIERDYKFHGQNCTEYTRWTFFSSLLFTITVMSTVGYGK
jgi:hypothetical protein